MDPAPILAALPRPAGLDGAAASLWDEAVKGLPEPGYKLALRFRDGDGVRKDDGQAIFWFACAANEGSALAIREMGNACATGALGYKVDFTAASNWYSKGIEHLDIPSEFAFGDMTIKGLGGKKDESAGFSYLLAAGSGRNVYGPSAAELAQLYAAGEQGAPKDARKAYLWSLLASSGTENTDAYVAKECPGWIKENATLQQSLEASLPKETATFLRHRRDALLAGQRHLDEIVVDDGPEPAVSIPSGGASGSLEPDAEGLLKVRVDFGDGKPHFFVIDSGVWFSNINPQVAAKLGLNVVGQATARFGKASGVFAANCRICGAEFKNLRFLVNPTSNMKVFDGLDGQLGTNFLEMTRVKIDFKKRAITFEPATARPEGAALPLTFNDGSPHAAVTVGGKGHQSFTAPALLDLGNSTGIVMNDDLNSEHPFKDLISGPIRFAGLATADGEYPAQIAHLPAIDLAGYRVTKALCVYEPRQSGATSSYLNVGLRVLNKFVLTLDYAQARAYLVPNDESVLSAAPDTANVALGKPVTASSEEIGNGAANATDGDPETRWCAAGMRMPQWLKVDLGTPMKIGACEITWERSAAGYKYRLEGSGDGIAWQPLGNEQGASPLAGSESHRSELHFPATAMRFIRVTVTAAVPGAWASIVDLRVLKPENGSLNHKS
ncbi:MAG TPA: discoidin domain-containing protein [Chthoniobacteraceae bacterium]|nr:discoidin domain-containing protein [Chthoniobacteraceae bacterium]